MSFLYDNQGRRKYLTIEERNSFLGAARTSTPEVFLFCAALAYTGARISELLALPFERIDRDAGLVIIESLKKRRRGVFRAVPLPEVLIQQLSTMTDHGSEWRRVEHSTLVWPWSRTTAWKHVKENMKMAGIAGLHASPRGLRHGFAVGALQMGLPINMVKKWLGHSRLSTTAIYADAVGAEEKAIADRYWKTFQH